MKDAALTDKEDIHKVNILTEVGTLLSFCQNELTRFPDYSGEVKQLVSISNQVEGDRAYYQAKIDNKIEEIRFLQQSRGK